MKDDRISRLESDPTIRQLLVWRKYGLFVGLDYVTGIPIQRLRAIANGDGGERVTGDELDALRRVFENFKHDLTQAAHTDFKMTTEEIMGDPRR